MSALDRSIETLVDTATPAFGEVIEIVIMGDALSGSELDLILGLPGFAATTNIVVDRKAARRKADGWEIFGRRVVEPLLAVQ